MTRLEMGYHFTVGYVVCLLPFVLIDEEIFCFPTIYKFKMTERLELGGKKEKESNFHKKSFSSLINL